MMFSCEATAPHNNYGCLEKENKTEFARIPEVMVKKVVYRMKKTADKLVKVEGKAFNVLYVQPKK